MKLTFRIWMLIIIVLISLLLIFPLQNLLGEKGPIVKSIDKNSSLFEAGLRQGQLITQINGQPIATIEDFNKAFKDVDILLTPTEPHPAFKIGANSNDVLAMYLEDIFVSGASLAGLPAISIPAGLVDGLPVGAQLIGPRLREDLILKIAEFISKK